MCPVCAFLTSSRRLVKLAASHCRTTSIMNWANPARRGTASKQCAGCRDVLSAVGVGKEPIVADAVEALGQHVHQEAPDELVPVKPHRVWCGS